MNVRTFTSLQDFIAFQEQLRQNQRQLDEAVAREQAALKPGDFAYRPYDQGPGGLLPIWIRVIDPGRLWDEATGAYTGTDYSAEDGRLFREPHMKHQRWTYCYSPACVEGEHGTTHVATCWPVAPEVFEVARTLKWGVTIEEAEQLLAAVQAEAKWSKKH